MHYTFAFICIFFNLFHQSLVAFSVEILYLLKFIPKYFIVLDATVNGIFFISISGKSLLMYRNATDFL